MEITQKSFLEKENLTKSLSKLTEATLPTFGTMQPQQMIEHLILSIESSYKMPFNPEKEIKPQQEQLKAVFLNPNTKFPRNIESSLYKNGVPPLKFENLAVAKENLVNSIENFENYFNQNKNQFCYNLIFGRVDYEELKIFHQKHITHHFEQFNLI